MGRVISAWLDGLAQEDRWLFLRRYWYGDSVNALAGDLGTTANHLSQRLLRLRKKLRRTLEQEGVDL